MSLCQLLLSLRQRLPNSSLWQELLLQACIEPKRGQKNSWNRRLKFFTKDGSIFTQNILDLGLVVRSLMKNKFLWFVFMFRCV